MLGVLTGAPSINNTIPDPPKQGAAKGQRVEVSVEFNVFPPPDDVTWRWSNGSTNGMAIPSNGYEVENTDTSSKLIILSITEQQFGNYTLMVTNDHGSLHDNAGGYGVMFEVIPHRKYRKHKICYVISTK